jgi:hypothetical protein
MKMVKKCIIALAVAALLVTTVQADDPVIKRDGTWPVQFIALDICTIPILMDVGHFVQIEDCDDLEIILKQVTCSDDDDFPCYEGCEDFNARANFPAVFDGRVDKNDSGIIDDTDVTFPNGNTIDPGDFQALKVCVTAKKAELWKATAPSDKTPVGNLVITVKPPDTDLSQL